MRWRRALLAVLSVVVLAGCGGGEETAPLPEDVEGTVAPTTTQATTQTGGGGNGEQGDPAAGREVFASAGCGTCHTLSDAGTNGTVGPNLDESQPDYDLAVQRVTNGGSGMPAFKRQLTPLQIDAISQYVTQNAGR